MCNKEASIVAFLQHKSDLSWVAAFTDAKVFTHEIYWLCDKRQGNFGSFNISPDCGIEVIMPLCSGTKRQFPGAFFD